MLEEAVHSHMSDNRYGISVIKKGDTSRETETLRENCKSSYTIYY